MSGDAPFINILQRRWIFIFIVVLALIVKVVLTIFSVWGFDFLYIVKAAVTGSLSPLSKAYWIYMNHLIYLSWLKLPFEHTDVTPWIVKLEGFPFMFNLYLLVFLLKLPILVLDVVCGFLVYRLALRMGSRSIALGAFCLWIWNPYVTLTAEMMGTNDILVVSLMLLTVLFFITKRRVLAGFSFFAAVASKLYPILLLPVLLIRVEGSKWRFFQISAAAAGIVAYFIWVEKVFSKSVLDTLLNYSPLTYLSSELLISPRSDLHIGLATFSVTLFAFGIYRFWNRKEDAVSTVDMFLAFLLVYFAFSNWWPQYLLLLMPFLVLKASKNRRWLVHSSVILGIAFLLSLTAFNLSGDAHLFFLSTYYDWMNKVAAFISQGSKDVVTVLVLQPILRSIYAGISLYYAAKLFVSNSPTLKRFIQRSRQNL